MIRMVHLADDGTELAEIEVDDFTVEVVYAGLADMLRDAPAPQASLAPPGGELPREARQRRQRVLSRIRD